MAAETGPRHPVDRKLGVVILGASTYPHFPPSRNLNNESFARSAAAFRSLIADEEASVFGKPAILNLFDVDDDPSSVIRQIKKFIGSEPALTDVLFYYCGHGDFLPDRTYYLTLKVTEPENEAFTGLPLRQMRLALETQLMRKRVFLVLDCCYSGTAAKEWMATGISHVIEEQVFQSFPKGGTALIAAPARSGPALAPEGESLTMFTGALINTILNGIAGEKRELSFRDIVDAVRTRISDRYGSAGVAPEIHAPRQDEGDITFTPFFVNRAFVPPPEFKAEREGFEFAVADLERWLPNTRVGAVATLEELLSSTQSAAFRVEILNKLRDVIEKDDSQRVRTKCEEVLARWPEPPILNPLVSQGTPEALPGTSGGGELKAKKSVLSPSPTKALLISAVFAIGAVTLAAYFFFAPGNRSVPSGDNENQVSLAVTQGDTGKSATASPVVEAPSLAAKAPSALVMTPTALGTAHHPVRLTAPDPPAPVPLRTLTGHTGFVHSVAFSPDGRTIASGSADNTIKLWDTASGQPLRLLTGHTNFVFSVAFSPHGRTLASGSIDKTIKLWDSASGQLLRTLTGHTDEVWSVAFSPDERTLASGLRTLTGHAGFVISVAFSPDGHTLASGSWDNSIKLWDVSNVNEASRSSLSDGSTKQR